MEQYLGFAASLVLGGMVFLYVVKDGKLLGVSLLWPLMSNEHRQVLQKEISNQGNSLAVLWLILAASGLLLIYPAVFLAYASKFWLVWLIMGLALGLRAWLLQRASTSDFNGAAMFGLALIISLAQGFALGAIMQGVEASLIGFGSLIYALCLPVGCLVLGLSWLLITATGDVRLRLRKLAWTGIGVLLSLIGLISLVTPFLHPLYNDRWFSGAGMLVTVIMPLVYIICAQVFAIGITKDKTHSPFYMAQALLVLCFISLLYSLAPNFEPTGRMITANGASAPMVFLVLALCAAGGVALRQVPQFKQRLL